MKSSRLLLPLIFASILAGCDIEPVAYLIDGGDHSLTIERRKPYFWSDGWELDVVVTRFPDCQRRYPLKKAGEKVRVDLYRTEPGVFILNQGKRWYVTETLGCRFQQFETEPPQPGDWLGAFRVKNDVFVFVPGEEDKGAKSKAGNSK